MWEIGALAAALALFITAAVVGINLVDGTSRARPIDPGTHPTAWIERHDPAPVVPQSVTTNVYIDTVNVYQAAPAPVETPLPAELRRIRPAIGR